MRLIRGQQSEMPRLLKSFQSDAPVRYASKCWRMARRLLPTRSWSYLPDGTQRKLTTDSSGSTGALTETGRYGAWARYWESPGGQRDGQAYTETRNYATLVFDISASAPASATPFATMPEATAGSKTSMVGISRRRTVIRQPPSPGYSRGSSLRMARPRKVFRPALPCRA